MARARTVASDEWRAARKNRKVERVALGVRARASRSELGVSPSRLGIRRCKWQSTHGQARVSEARRRMITGGEDNRYGTKGQEMEIGTRPQRDSARTVLTAVDESRDGQRTSTLFLFLHIIQQDA